MRKINFLFIYMLLLLVALGCSNSNKSEREDGKTGQRDVLGGALTVMVDESVLPLMEEQVEVFQSSYTNARVQLVPSPERVAINSLIKGEGNFAILTRTLTEEESKGFKSRSVDAKVFPIAYDGIVLIANSSTVSDSTMILSDVADYLQGKQSEEQKLVFDNVNSSSVRYLKDLFSLERINARNIMEGKNIEGVLDLLSKEDHNIAVLSLNQYLDVKNSLDSNKNIRTLSIKNEETGKFVKPSQSTLGDNSYPLKQTVYVLNYQSSMGLGIGFSAFLTGDRGQRVVLKSGLLPATMPGREIIIRDELNVN